MLNVILKEFRAKRVAYLLPESRKCSHSLLSSPEDETALCTKLCLRASETPSPRCVDLKWRNNSLLTTDVVACFQGGSRNLGKIGEKFTSRHPAKGAPPRHP
jgi:hypothetical protein